MDKLQEYYATHRELFASVAHSSGFYNLGWVGPAFHGDFEAAQRSMVHRVLESLRLSPKPLLIDIGCGQGAPALLAAETYQAQVLGVDMLKEQIAEAENKRKQKPSISVTFLVGSAQAIPVTTDSADGAYSIESAFHYPDKTAFLQEAARILKPGARLAVADILINEGYEKHWTHGGFKRALSAPELWTTARYREEAVKAGFTPLHAYDLTRGVMRSLRLAGKKLFPRIPRLVREGHPIFQLFLLQAGFIHLLWTHPLVPAKYRLLVFQKR